MSKISKSLVAIYLVSLFGCGGSEDTSTVAQSDSDSKKVIPGAYRLKELSLETDCSGAIKAAISANIEAAKRQNLILDVETVDIRTMRASIRGTSVTVLLSSTQKNQNRFKGSFSQNANLLGCTLTNKTDVTVQGGNKKIEVDLSDSFKSTPEALNCPIPADSCKSSSSLEGNSL